MEFCGIHHTFVICAYQESKYLEQCILSLKKQTVKSNLLITTSTPNKFIKHMAEKYSIKMCINCKKGGIAEDWNFAYASASTPLVTLAHQDDIYCKEYLEKVLEKVNKNEHPLIVFTDYYEIRDNKIIKKNKLLIIKRILLAPLKFSYLWGSRFVRRRILSLGSAICCPSVTMYKPNLPPKLFESNLMSNIDWQAWEKISKHRGSFIYIAKPLMRHRIHEESTTTAIVEKNARREEDILMFCKFWPKPIAFMIEKIYQNGEKSNRIR